MLNSELLVHWVKERESIRLKKEAGETRPWTLDPILQKYKFTNVHREDDRVSHWVAENLREPADCHPDLWFVMTIAILVNWPDTLETCIWPHEAGKFVWNEQLFIDQLHERKANGDKVFSGAYIVSTNGRSMDKAEYLAKRVLTPLWNQRKFIRPRFGDALALFFERLNRFDGMGSFISAQVVAATKYEGYLKDAPDWWEWAASGPGSRRGMNRLYGFDINKKFPESVWLKRLQNSVRPLIEDALGCAVHAQDCQNCLCEFDKYMRVKLGEGKPRSKYPGV